MKQQFIDNINAGKFLDAKKLISTMPSENILTFLQGLIFETNLISIYTFIAFLLLEKETIFLHQCARSILCISMWEGANAAALLHTQRIYELDPHDITKKASVLSYFGTPDCTMSHQEAQKMAQEILEQDPTNTTALKTLDVITKSEKNPR